jgi:uncharacterized membrane protein
MRKAENFFTSAEKEAIKYAIEEAEKNTSGEIRVHLENHCSEDVLDRATAVFAKLDMHKTELRNGVLFYLAIVDRKFAIIGDAGINAVVPDNFWDKTKEEVLEQFKKGDFALGLSTGIILAGEALKMHFPFQQNDLNELSDEISFGKN